MGDQQMTLNMPSEKLGKEILQFAKDVYIRMLTPSTEEVSVPSKSMPLNYHSLLLQTVRAQYLARFTDGVIESEEDIKEKSIRPDLLSVDHLSADLHGGSLVVPAFLIPDMSD